MISTGSLSQAIRLQVEKLDKQSYLWDALKRCNDVSSLFNSVPISFGSTPIILMLYGLECMISFTGVIQHHLLQLIHEYLFQWARDFIFGCPWKRSWCYFTRRHTPDVHHYDSTLKKYTCTKKLHLHYHIYHSLLNAFREGCVLYSTYSSNFIHWSERVFGLFFWISYRSAVLIIEASSIWRVSLHASLDFDILYVILEKRET